MRVRAATPREAKHACLAFHYAKTYPCLEFKYSVFNDAGEWCGCVIFNRGANSHIGSEYGLMQGEVVELSRVALNGKQGHGFTTKAVMMCVRRLKRDKPFVRLIVSYADIDQDHAGTIYQAMNFVYAGDRNEGTVGPMVIHGRKMHKRSVGAKGWVQNLEWIRENVDPDASNFVTKGKRKYLLALDKKTRKRIEELAKPYPKKDRG